MGVCIWLARFQSAGQLQLQGTQGNLGPSTWTHCPGLCDQERSEKWVLDKLTAVSATFPYPRLPRLKGSLEDEQHLKAASLPCPGHQSEKNAAEKMNDKLRGEEDGPRVRCSLGRGSWMQAGRQLTITGHLLYTGGLGRARGLTSPGLLTLQGRQYSPRFAGEETNLEG